MYLLKFIVLMMVLSGFSIIRDGIRMMKKDYNDRIEITFCLEIGFFVGYLILLLNNYLFKWF